jgi:hypothetical protein
MRTEAALTDWVQAISTVVALVLSVAALWQAAAFRREELRGQLLCSLIDQLKGLRVQEQRAEQLVRRTEPTTALEATELAHLHNFAEQLRAHAKQGIGELEPLLKSIVVARGWGIGRRLLAWRADIDQHGTYLPQIDLQISELSDEVDAALSRLPPSRRA